MKPFLSALLLFPLLSCSQNRVESTAQGKDASHMSDEQWKEKLTDDQFNVCRMGGTEAPGSGKYLHWKKQGTFTCVACGNELFSSDTKYDSGSGWPSFWEPKTDANVNRKTDKSLGMTRVEVTCNKCDSHLGHVFEDGPEPTGKRYCINSAALDFVEKKD